MTFHTEVVEGVLDPLEILFSSTVSIIPGLIAAIIILVIGFLIALVIGSAAKQLVRFVKADEWMRKHGTERAIGGLKVSHVIGKLVKWWIFIVFLVPAANVIDLPNLSEVLVSFALWFPNLIIGIVITLFGLVVADIASKAVGEAKKLKGIQGVRTVVYIIVLLLFLSVALRQIGINVVLAESIIMIIVAGVMLSIAIGFGLGMKPYAENTIKHIYKKLK